jgi:PKD repeat protein
MKKFYISCVSCFLFIVGFSQAQTVTLTFIGKDAGSQTNLPLESVYIRNTTLGCDTTIYGSTPSLVIKPTLDVQEYVSLDIEPIIILPPVPNPFNGTTCIRIAINRTQRLNLRLLDAQGKIVASLENEFAVGLHSFQIETQVKNYLFFHASSGHFSKSVKLISNGSGMGNNRLTYLGSEIRDFKSGSSTPAFIFHIGDQLLFESFKSGYEESIIIDSPSLNSAYTFQLTPNNNLTSPSVSTDSAADITQTSATFGGDVTASGGSLITDRGVCWSNSPNPTLSDNHLSIGSGLGPFSNLITGLLPYSSYNVRAYATNSTGTGYGNEIHITTLESINPLPILSRLAGINSKTWKLLRVPSGNRYPLLVMPYDRSTIWWAMGLNNNELAIRPCMLNDEWTFGLDSSMKFDAKGDYWAEGGLFMPENICASTSYMVGPNGENQSAWGNGNHTFNFPNNDTSKIQVVGLGAYLGLCKVGNGLEVKVPQLSVTYDLVKLCEGNVDTLIVETPFKFNAGDPDYGGIWQFVLVHYDNPADEPPIPGLKPEAGFTFTSDGPTVTFTNTTIGGVTYLWDFGDGQTSVLMNPSHTYATAGIFTISLTANNPNGSSTVKKDFYYSSIPLTALTDSILQGAPWKVRLEENSIFVGSGLGKDDWWGVPLIFLNGSVTGMDNWSCIVDDEFTFGAGGTYTYATHGSARNDGYFGGANGCIDDATIAASGNSAAFGSATHSYQFTAAVGNGRPKIMLSNGLGKAAFIGFYKGYNGIGSGGAGGENVNNSSVPNGGATTNTYEVMFYANSAVKETLVISVDFSNLHDGTMAWSVILER